MSKNAHHINLIPPHWQTGYGPDPTASLVATLFLTALVVGVCFLVVASEPIVHADGSSVVLSRSPPAERGWVDLEDPVAFALARASAFYPWDELFDGLSKIAPSGTHLDSVSYQAPGPLTVTGEITEVSLLPELMLGLESHLWLRDPDPFMVEKDPTTGRTRFAIRVRVIPFLELKTRP